MCGSRLYTCEPLDHLFMHTGAAGAVNLGASNDASAGASLRGTCFCNMLGLT